jgi:type I restriction enzyme S subunit
MVYEGSQRLGDFFKTRREKGMRGLPMLSVTLTEGLVDRDSLDRRTDSSLAAEEHLLVRKGDIVYNMMRMWQGASGLAEKDGLVSPAYVVLAPKQIIDPLYAAFLFKSHRLIYLFWAYSYGLTEDRLRLYYQDFAQIPVSVPAIAEQRKIAKVLSVWNRAIDCTDRLIANTKALRRAMLQRLLGSNGRKPAKRLAQPEFRTFASLVRTRCAPANGDASLPCIELEHMEPETGRLLGSTSIALQSSLKAVFEPGDLLVGKLRPYLRKVWLADSHGYCSTEIWVFRANRSRCLPEFLSLLCQSGSFVAACHVTSGSKMPRGDWSIVSRARFRLPPLEGQRAIVAAIARASDALANLFQQRVRLQVEKKGLQAHLFDGIGE